MKKNKKRTGPYFDTSRRYVDRNGVKYGKGVWYDANGSLMRVGIGHLANDDKTVKQYNSDGTITSYTRQQYARKKMEDEEIRLLQRDRKYAIPYIPEKRMTVSIPEGVDDHGVRGATFSSNVLDSIAVNARRAGIPFKTALGIAAKESTLGHNKERTVGNSLLPWLQDIYNPATPSGNALWQKSHAAYEGMQSPTLLVSDWQQYDSPFAEYLYDSNLNRRTKPAPEKQYNDNFRGSLSRDSRRIIEDKSPLQHAFEKYKRNPSRYNSGEKGYVQGVNDRGSVLVNYSPEIRKHMEDNNIKAYGGQMETLAEWDSLTPTEKSAYIGAAVRQGMRSLPEIREAYNEFASGGNLYRKGGKMPEYKWNGPSREWRQKIDTWEGAAQHRATIDPLSGKLVSKNKGYDEVTRAFISAIPDDLKDFVLNNPQYADALYSYGFNVGMGRMRSRVIPTLRKYVRGEATPEQLANSMWASGDRKLRGLAKRRAVERSAALSALGTGLSTMPHGNYPLSGAGVDSGSQQAITPYQEQAMENAAPPVITPAQPVEVNVPDIEDPFAAEDTPAQSEVENPYARLMNMMAVQNTYGSTTGTDVTPPFMPKDYDSSAPFVARILGGGGDKGKGKTGDPARQQPYDIPVPFEYKVAEETPKGLLTTRHTYLNYYPTADSPDVMEWYDPATNVRYGDNNPLGSKELIITPANGYIDENGNKFREYIKEGDYKNRLRDRSGNIINKADVLIDENGSLVTRDLTKTPLEKEIEEGNRGYWERVKDNGRLLLSEKGPIGALKNVGLFPDLSELSNVDMAWTFPLFKKFGKKLKDTEGKIQEEKPFVSELDWSPESWFENRADRDYDANDIKAFESHMPEYLSIERKAKADGTWLRNADGSIWQEDPREWVMSRSKNAQWLNTKDPFYSGIRDITVFDPSYQGMVWGSNNYKIASTYAPKNSEVQTLYYPRNAKVGQFNANGAYWANIIDSNGKQWSTNDIVKKMTSEPYNNGVVKVLNVRDQGPDRFVWFNNADDALGTDYILKDKLPRKSVLGNNGNFDIKNKNMYKALLPLTLITPFYVQNDR